MLPREGLRSLAEQGGATIVGCSPSRAVDRFRFLSYLQRSAMRTHSGIFSTVTFESQRSTEEERSWSLLQRL